MAEQNKQKDNNTPQKSGKSAQNKQDQRKKQKTGSDKKESGGGSGFPQDPIGKYRRGLFFIILGVILVMWIWSTTGTGGVFGNYSEIKYSTFKQQVEDGNVEQVMVKGDRIQGTLKQPTVSITPAQDTLRYRSFVTYYPTFGDEELMPLLKSNNVEIITQPSGDNSWWTMLIWMLPLILMIFIGFQFFRRMQGQGQQIFQIGQSQAKLHEGKSVDVTFDDVAGADGAKEELIEIIDYLKYPERFAKIGGRVPKGVLLVGPPGTGKTLLARAVAGEADVPFFSITGSDFMEMFVGVGAKRVRDMFKKAKDREPAIIFIDELDSIGRQRGAGLGGGHDEREQTLNQLLSELDGFEPNENVIVMAATNRPDILDKALLRPGRFDRQVTVDLPTKTAREAILKIHARNKQLHEDVDLEDVARSTPGFSGADLENLLNEAALLTARDERERIKSRDIDNARDKVMMGLERKGMAISDEERKMLAYHEGGHAVVAAAMPHSDPIHKVTIIPRGRAMGVTQQMPKEDKYLYVREYMLDRMAVIMGGRAAEGLIFNTKTSGAANDLKQVTQLSRRMVMEWGMSDKFGHLAFGSDQQQVFLGRDMGHQREFSEVTARELDEEVHHFTEDAYQRAIDTLKKHRNVLDKVAELLLERDEIPGSKVMELLENDGVEVNKEESSEEEQKQKQSNGEQAKEEESASETSDGESSESEETSTEPESSENGTQEGREESDTGSDADSEDENREKGSSS